MIQIGGVYTTFCWKEGILLQTYRDKNGRCIAILVKSIGVRGRFDSPILIEFGILLFPRSHCSAASGAANLAQASRAVCMLTTFWPKCWLASSNLRGCEWGPGSLLKSRSTLGQFLANSPFHGWAIPPVQLELSRRNFGKKTPERPRSALRDFPVLSRARLPWTGKSCFSNRAVVKAFLEALKCL